MVNISSNEVHLWHIYDENIHDHHLLSQYYKILSAEETAKQKRFYLKKNRHQYLITRAAVRSILSLYVNAINPDEWEFKKNEYGKPFISNSDLPSPLHFNVSHTNKLIVLAVTLEKELGVDVEYLPRPGNILDMARGFFSPSEVKQLLDLPPENQRHRFFDLWTLKEAYVKACGMGLSIPLNHFSFSFSELGRIIIDFIKERGENDQSEYWQFWQVHPNNTHKIAIALKTDKINMKHTISMKNFIPLSDVVEINYPMAHGSIILPR